MDAQPSPFSSDATRLLALSAALRDRGYHFVAVTPATHQRVNTRAENLLARDMRDVFGWSRPFLREALDGGLFDAARQAGTLQAVFGEREYWRCSVRAATLDGQIFLHSAYPTDAPDAVFFGPDTYRFADALNRSLASCARSVRRAADIGCGSGAAGILMALAFPEASVVLADINEAALAASRVNARAAGVTNAACVRSDLFDDVSGLFDIIVANPPYLIDPAARTYRHGGGRRGEGLSLTILRGALPRLAPGGRLLLYTGSAIIGGLDVLLQQAQAILADAGWQWTYREADPDVFGDELHSAAYGDADRIAAVVLTVERPA